MGRNKFGGNKQKAMENSNNDHAIFKQHESQMYVIVTKALGNSSFQVADENNTFYTAIVRGKMKGRAKRKFFININDILLVQFRDFASNKNVTDIIQIYNSNHYPLIKNAQSLLLITQQNIKDKHYNDNDIIFTQQFIQHDTDHNNTTHDYQTFIKNI
jgi:initiation factor 1A